MNKLIIGAVLLSVGSFSQADTLPFDLSITGDSFDTHKSLQLSDVGESINAINFDFTDSSGQAYSFDLKYKKLPLNRSYPTNLDITINDSKGNKLAYLFLANNGVQALKRLAVFGLVFNANGKMVDVRFTFDKNKKGILNTASLGNERFVQDTLVGKFNFQMIRPVIVPSVKPGLRSVSYSLDNHPYEVNYSILDKQNGGIEFQHNLYSQQDGNQQLLERIYFHADSLDTLREVMYAGKYFHPEDGTFKLVFYPAMGQTAPLK